MAGLDALLVACQNAASSRSAWCFMNTSRTASLPSRNGPKVSGNTSRGPTLYQISPLISSSSLRGGGHAAEVAVGDVFDLVVVVEHHLAVRVTPKFFHSMSPGRCWRPPGP
jgi:hypothetical protein